MAVDRLTITVDAELSKELRQIAKSEGTSVSGWVSEAIEHRVRNHLLGKALDAWEAETGPSPLEAQKWADDAFAEVEKLKRAVAEELADRLAS